MLNLLVLTISLALTATPPIRCKLQDHGDRFEFDPEFVTAIECEGAPGFFVHSDRYRLIRNQESEMELASLERDLYIEKSEELTAVVSALTQTSSHAVAQIRLSREIVDIAEQRARECELESRQYWWRDSRFWSGVSAGTIIGAIATAVFLSRF